MKKILGIEFDKRNDSYCIETKKFNIYKNNRRFSFIWKVNNKETTTFIEILAIDWCCKGLSIFILNATSTCKNEK